MRPVLTVLALWAAGLGAAAQFGKISVLYDLLGAQYPAQAGVGIGFLLSIVGIVGLIFGTTAGVLVARIGPRRAILAALGLGAAVSLVQTTFPAYPVMMLTRVFEGISHLTIVIVGPVMIAQISAGRFQGLAMTLWSSFFGVTYALLAAFAPGLIASHGAAALFFTHSGWMTAMGLLLWKLLPKDPPQRASNDFGDSILRQHLAIYASPFIAAPATGFVCYTITYVAVLTLLPSLVAPEWTAFIAVAMPLMSIAVSLTLGVWLLSLMQGYHLVQLGFAVATLATVGLWSVWGQGALVATFALILAAALGIVQGASFATLAQLNPEIETRSQAAGAIAQLGNLGTTTGTPLLAFLLVKAGISGLALFLIGFSILGIVLHAWQARRREA